MLTLTLTPKESVSKTATHLSVETLQARQPFEHFSQGLLESPGPRALSIRTFLRRGVRRVGTPVVDDQDLNQRSRDTAYGLRLTAKGWVGG